MAATALIISHELWRWRQSWCVKTPCTCILKTKFSVTFDLKLWLKQWFFFFFFSVFIFWLLCEEKFKYVNLLNGGVLGDSGSVCWDGTGENRDWKGCKQFWLVISTRCEIVQIWCCVEEKSSRVVSCYFRVCQIPRQLLFALLFEQPTIKLSANNHTFVFSVVVPALALRIIVT